MGENMNKFPNFEKRKKDFQCSIGFAMTVIGGKWRAIILWNIMKKEIIRYGELKKAIPNISHKVLAKELNTLEEDGLIIRKAYPTIPPKVEYSTSQLGESLRPILQQMCTWSKQYME